MRLSLGEIAGQAQVGYPDMTVLVQEYISWLQVPVHHKTRMHVFESQDDLGGVELDLFLREDAVLRKMVVQVSSCRRIKFKENVKTGIYTSTNFLYIL